VTSADGDVEAEGAVVGVGVVEGTDVAEGEADGDAKAAPADGDPEMEVPPQPATEPTARTKTISSFIDWASNECCSDPLVDG
jgi:hypothetical protein